MTLTSHSVTTLASLQGNPRGLPYRYQQGIFFGFEFQNSVFLEVLVIVVVFVGGCQLNAVSLGVLCFQQYFLGSVLFTMYFSKHSSSLLSSRT